MGYGGNSRKVEGLSDFGEPLGFNASTLVSWPSILGNKNLSRDWDE
jgi:hypothetical protein